MTIELRSQFSFDLVHEVLAGALDLAMPQERGQGFGKSVSASHARPNSSCLANQASIERKPLDCAALVVLMNRDNPSLRSSSYSSLCRIVGPMSRITAVRLKVEKNQLVGIFGEIGVLVDGLKYA